MPPNLNSFQKIAQKSANVFWDDSVYINKHNDLATRGLFNRMIKYFRGTRENKRIANRRLYMNFISVIRDNYGDAVADNMQRDFQHRITNGSKLRHRDVKNYIAYVSNKNSRLHTLSENMSVNPHSLDVGEYGISENILAMNLIWGDKTPQQQREINANSEIGQVRYHTAFMHIKDEEMLCLERCCNTGPNKLGLSEDGLINQDQINEELNKEEDQDESVAAIAGLAITGLNKLPRQNNKGNFSMLADKGQNLKYFEDMLNQPILNKGFISCNYTGELGDQDDVIINYEYQNSSCKDLKYLFQSNTMVIIPGAQIEYMATGEDKDGVRRVAATISMPTHANL